ncbi:ABC transporter substrate-binding protein [Jatrophihabitans sp. DSM 45814]
MRGRAIRITVTAIAVVALATTACSSSKKSSDGSAGGTSAATGGTIKIGVITDSSGPFSSSFTTTEKGIKAYTESINAAGGVNGKQLDYVMADTTSTVPGALLAAQKLVQKDKVFAVVEVSAVFSGAQPYLLKAGIPVVGGGFDGPEWNVSSNTNLFAATGVTDYSKVNSAPGEFMKSQGVTVCGSIGYPNATAGPSAVAVVKSCEAAGLKNGYLNTQVPTGSTDVGAIAIAMKNAGVDGVSIPVVASTGFALAAALKQLGVKLKVLLLATGYGGDLLASPAAVTAGQGFMFSSVGNPVEANTPATQKFVADLAKVGVTDTPTFAEQEAYIAMSAVDTGLKAAGNNPTQASFSTALRAVHDFDAGGLLSPAKIDFSNFAGAAAGAGAGGCIFAATLTNKTFVPVPGTPLCGKTLPGLTTG